MRVGKANLLVQALALATAPVLTRLYSPVDFGAAALFASLLSFLSAFATWRFEWSIPSASSRMQAAALALLSCGVLLTVSIASYVVLTVFKENADYGSAFQSLAPFTILLPVALTGTGVHLVLQAWFTRERDLTAVSKAQIRQSIVGNVLSVAGGFIGLGSGGLIASSAISTWAGINILLKHAPDFYRILFEQSYVHLRKTFKQFMAEASVSSAVSIVNIAGTAAVPFLFAYYYSVAEVGWYALMTRVALTPVHLLSRAIGQSFWSEATSLVDSDRTALRRLYLKTARRLALSTVPVGLLCVSGPLLAGSVFGSEWLGAGYILLALAPGVIAQLVVQPITHLIVHKKQHWKLHLDFWKLAVTLAGATWFAQEKVSIHYVVAWLSVTHVCGYLILFCLNLRCLSPSPQLNR